MVASRDGNLEKSLGTWAGHRWRLVDLENAPPSTSWRSGEGAFTLRWESIMEFLPDTSQPSLFVFQEEKVMITVCK